MTSNDKSCVSVGATVENGSLRIHRYRECIVLWDLANAGKRGRTVTKLSLMPSLTDRDATLECLSGMLAYCQDFGAAETILSGWMAEHPSSVEMHRHEERGVDVVPAGFMAIKVDTAKLSLEVGYREFSVQDSSDTNNLPTCIPAIKGSLKSIPAFYRWVRDNQDKVREMSFRDVLEQMQVLGVKYHYYCAMD